MHGLSGFIKRAAIVVAWLPMAALAEGSGCELATFVEVPLSTAFVHLRQRSAASSTSPRLWGRFFSKAIEKKPALLQLSVSPTQFVREHRRSISSVIDTHALGLHPLDPRFRQLGLADTIVARDYSRRMMLAEMPVRVTVIKSAQTNKEFFLLYLGELNKNGQWPADTQENMGAFYVVENKNDQLKIVALAQFEGSLSPDEIRLEANQIPCLNPTMIQRFETTERFIAANNHLLNITRTLSYDQGKPPRLRHSETKHYLFPLNENNRQLIADLALLGAQEALIFESTPASNNSPKNLLLQRSQDRFAPFRTFQDETAYATSLSDGGIEALERYSSSVANKATFFSIESARTLAHPELQDYFSRIAKLATNQATDQAADFLSGAISVFQDYEGIDLGHLKALREWIRVGELITTEITAAQRALDAFALSASDSESVEQKLFHQQQLQLAFHNAQNVSNNLVAFRKMFLGQLEAIEGGLRQLAQANHVQATLTVLRLLKMNSEESLP